jgi:CheY-like chemotaxis protein
MTKLPRSYLLVDDDPDTLALLSASVKDIRTKVQTAVNLHDAQLRLDQMIQKDIAPEIIVLDLVLPDVSDLSSVISILKDKCPTAKFIAMSAYYTHGSLDQVIHAGFQGYLMKPFLDPNNLRNYFKRVMRSTKSFTYL